MADSRGELCYLFSNMKRNQRSLLGKRTSLLVAISTTSGFVEGHRNLIDLMQIWISALEFRSCWFCKLVKNQSGSESGEWDICNLSFKCILDLCLFLQWCIFRLKDTSLCFHAFLIQTHPRRLFKISELLFHKQFCWAASITIF